MATQEHLPRTGWLEQLRKPHIQALAGLAIMLTFLAFGLVGKLSGGELSERYGYQTAATSMMLFGVGNALMSLSADNVNKYWTASFLSFVGLSGVGLLLAYAFSGLWLTEAGSYRWIYIVVTFGYLVLLSIMSMMRGIVNFAEREEWSQPRRRDRR